MAEENAFNVSLILDEITAACSTQTTAMDAAEGAWSGPSCYGRLRNNNCFYPGVSNRGNIGRSLSRKKKITERKEGKEGGSKRGNIAMAVMC